jgi:ABC-type transporter Mla subunit MlaD
MTKTILVSTILALLCAGPATATAALSQNAGVPAAHASRVAHQNLADMRAAVLQRPTMFPSARPQPYPYNFHETDGLSRNPNDCAVWGCIDSN